MHKSELIKECALSLLKSFVSPLIDSLSQIYGESNCEFVISLYEQNELSPGGLSLNVDFLKIPELKQLPQTASLKQISRKLCNIERIRLETKLKLCDSIKENTIEVIFSSGGYSISKMQKFYRFDDLPSDEDISFLISNLWIDQPH